MAYETAEYQIIKTISNKIEIREYKNLVLATTSRNENISQNSNFRTLFKFITGDNKENQKIEMTTPVFQKNIQNQSNMSFVMPSNFDKNNTPKPNSKNIKIEFLKNLKFIAIRFSGRSNDKNFNKHKKILEGVIQEKNIKVDLINPINAYYNSPWTLPFFRRNEILFQIK